jgi:UDP-2,3-diacylglucosamine pyrophosphatase LpxH
MKKNQRLFMNKPVIGVIADLHFGNKGHSHLIFEEQMTFIETQFFPYVLENKIKLVYQLGDTFHSRDKVDWYILNELKKRYFQWFGDNAVELHTLIGNHDATFKNTIDQNSLTETAKYFKNVFVYDSPKKVTHGSYVVGIEPWIVDYTTHTFLDKVDILLLHADIKTFPMMKGIYAKNGVEVSQFKNYNLVLSGHYHQRSIIDNVHMVGSPFQLGWGDYNQQRGFMVLDDNFNYEYIQNKINPQHVKIFYDEDEISILGLDYTDQHTSITKEESLDIAKNNYCRLFFVNVSDELKLETYHASLLSVSCNNYKIDRIDLKDVVEDYDDSAFDEAFEAGETTLQLITACIEGMVFDTEIDKNLLIELSRTEYKNAHDEVLSIGDNE